MALTTTREYRSTDAGAPVLTGQVGSGIAWLKACLVAGYGSGGSAKAPAGWTVAYEDAPGNVCVLRNSLAAGGSGVYLRVDDNGSGAGGAREMLVRLYATMSDAHTGTEPTPSTAVVPSGHVWRKSLDLTSTARPWVLIADERTVTLGVWPGYLSGSAQAGHYAGYAGDYDCDDAAQPWPCAIAGGSLPASGAIQGCTMGIITLDVSTGSNNGIFVMRGVSRSVGAVEARIQSLNRPLTNQALGSSSMSIPNPTPGGHTLFHPAVLFSDGTVIGRLRGVHLPQQNVVADPLGTVYPSALGMPSGSRLVAIKHHGGNSSNLAFVGQVAVEAVNPW